MKREIVTRGDEETEEEGRRLAASLVPEDVVYHAVEVERLTPAFFRDYHRRKARGDFQWS